MPFLLNRIYHEHIICGLWNRDVGVKVMLCIIVAYNRSKRPEFFPMLYLGVQQFLCMRICRVCKDASCAKSSWAPFHAKLEPADNIIGMQQSCGLFYQLILVLELSVGYLVFIKKALYVCIRIAWTEIGSCQLFSFLSKDRVVD